MYTFVLIIHVTVALTLIGIVLLQKGKGATIGAAFGGSSQTLFGPRGPATALAKITTGAAIIFMLTSISLSVMAGAAKDSSVMEQSGGAPAELPTTLPPREVETTAPDLITPTPVEEDKPPSEDVGPVQDSVGQTDSTPATSDEPVGPTTGE